MRLPCQLRVSGWGCRDALAAKLGITADTRLLLIRAPLNLPTLDDAPPSMKTPRPSASPYDVCLVFSLTLAELHRSVEQWPRADVVWLCWPKRASGVVTDVTEAAVRAAGLSTLTWVDVKIAAIDATWSGLMFRRRR